MFVVRPSTSLALYLWLFGQVALGETAVKPSFDPFAASSRCPISCNDDLTQWMLYPSVYDLDTCNSTLLFRFNVYNNISDAPVQACVPASAPAAPSSTSRLLLRLRQVLPFSNRRATSDAETKSKDVQLFKWTSEDAKPSVDDMHKAASILSEQLKIQSSVKSDAVLLAKQGKIIIGGFAGSELEKASVADIATKFAKWNSQRGDARQTAAEICDKASFSSQILGLAMDTEGNLANVKEKLQNWARAKCVGSKGAAQETLKDVSVSVVPTQPTVPGNSNSKSNKTTSVMAGGSCKTINANPGDGCWSLASRCGISLDDFEKYNANGMCNNNIIVGQHVCCSSGGLPDFSPQPNPDGSCKTHTINEGDLCATLASQNDITVDQINERNKKVWGWTGCLSLYIGSTICLSEGTPPMPAPIDNAICGPQVPGTKKPSNMDDLASLNACPLKACCNVWGQCGTTADFCIPAPADTGAPGTSKPGANGCIYNCGMDIVNNGSPPKTFIKVGYFEAWNLNRPCLHMRASQIDTTKYTHIHFAFANITHDFKPDVSGSRKQFDEFKNLKNVKRILSFGGWSFSTDADTAPIFRIGVTDSQRQNFANNVVSFIKDQGLDGVDFDWEYPGAPDIPGIPPGDKGDGERYLQFLKLFRNQLPSDKSMGLAAPASYWYLKGFPIAEMSKVLDYIIYMTYDLHGQWDYGNKWANPGCPEGNCLRSHVNTTETMNALVMITKAGVQSNKVIIGMPLYGRSFKMSQEGCWGANCHFEGLSSQAKPGRCTDTRGYISNYELREIMASDSDVQLRATSDGDIILYDKTERVSWMSPTSYDLRVSLAKSLNFGGTSDWAIDLDASYNDGDGPGSGGDSGAGYVVISPQIYSQSQPAVWCYPPCTFVLPPLTLSTATTIPVPPETVTFEENWVTTVTISGNKVITTKAMSITSTVITPPPVTTTEIPLYDITWHGGDDDHNSAVFPLRSSIVPPPLTFTRTRTNSDDPRPPVIWTFHPRPQPTPKNDDDPNPPPPPPPPTPYPSGVTAKKGPPRPTCKPGEKCGHPCRENCDPGKTHCTGFCGCIGPLCSDGDCFGPFCGDGSCVGLACIGTGGGGGGGGDDGPDKCRKRSSVSDCRVPCTETHLPNTVSSTCKDEKCCNTRYGCSITGTTTTTTVTASCPAPATYARPGDKDPIPIVGQGDLGGYIFQTGDYPQPTGNLPTKTATTTTTSHGGGGTNPTRPAYPTLRPSAPSPPPYCFRTHNEDGRYHTFQWMQAGELLANLCSNMPLSPDNTLGYVSRNDGSGLVGYIRWAADQNGCKKRDANVGLGDYCEDSMHFIGDNCHDDKTPDQAYGGAYVEDMELGCIEWFLGVDSPKNNLKMGSWADGADGGVGGVAGNATTPTRVRQTLKATRMESSEVMPLPTAASAA